MKKDIAMVEIELEFSNHQPALWTKDFILVCISNMLLSASFYMLIPVLPFYLIETLSTNGSTTGIVLSLYTVAALVIRPFSGYLVDTFSRKPFYLVCYGIFSIIFAGYAVATVLTLFIVLRILHGFSFGLSTVSGNTLAIDMMPSQRRGEGIGYYGMTSNIAMAIGPAAGMWIYQHQSFEFLFLTSFVISFIGFLTILPIKTDKEERREVIEKQPFSWDRFMLIKALPCVALLFLVTTAYGSMTNYIGLYSESASYKCSAGTFFLIVSIGVILARLSSARILNRGKISLMIGGGTVMMVVAFVLFAVSAHAATFYIAAFLLGAGFGNFSPAFQTLFINLAEHNQRGTANATYFTFFDLGMGLGIATGGMIIEKLNFQWLFGICAGIIVLGLIYFTLVSAPYFKKNKLR